MRKLVMCRILLAASALPASVSLAQGKGPARGEDLSTQAQDRVESKESSPSTESVPAPPVDTPPVIRDDPAPASEPASEPASAGRSEPPPERQESSNREAGRTTEPGLSPHYREMEERNQRRYERERRREDDKDGGAERHHRGDGGDGKGGHRRHHRHHRYIDRDDDDLPYFARDDFGGAGEEIAMPVVGMRFDPEVCSLFTGISGLLRNMFGNHRCRVLDAARYGLPAPGPGRLWLRVLKDAILVDGSDGRVVDIVRDAVR